MTNNISSNSSSSYDYSHIMELHNKKNRTQAETQEYNEARANNPELDQALYNQDKAEVTAFVDKIQEILRKTARGEKLTDEEQKMVENDADLAKKVSDVKQQKDNAENQLKNASPEQRKQILNNMMMQLSQKSEYTSDDMATMEIVQQLMYKYGNDNDDNSNNNENNNKNSSLSTFQETFSKNLHYEYTVE